MNRLIQARATQSWMRVVCLFSIALNLALGSCAHAEDSSTNRPTRWLPLAEVLKKWGDVAPETIQRAAQGGDLTAAHYLGYCYAEGLRFQQDPALGVKWYLRAGEAGYLPSYSNLGILYEKGKGVPQDFSKALQYYRLAANNGFPQAQANIGFLYRDGLGVQRDPITAMKWFRLAAQQQHGTAMVEIGRFHRFGQGVPKNLEIAESWFRKAVEQGDSLAELNLGLLHEEKGDLRSALGFFQQAAAHGSKDAMVSLYFAYWNGKGVATDRAQAVRWLTNGAVAGSPYAQCLLGYYYENTQWEGPDNKRRLPPPNMPEAVKWYRRSADQNWAGGQYHLGKCYIAGKGVEPDEERGLELIRKAADQNHIYAMSELVNLYARGIGEPRNEQDRPLQILTRITEIQNRDSEDNYYQVKKAYESIAFRYEYGVGTERDIFAAADWFCRASVAGFGDPSLEDKLEIGPPSSRPLQSYHGEAERSLILIAMPVAGGTSDRLLAALSRYLKAVSGNSEALKEIGDQYLVGRDVPVDTTKAWLWFTLAMRHGGPDARERIHQTEARMTESELERARELLPGFIRELNKVAAVLPGVTINENLPNAASP